MVGDRLANKLVCQDRSLRGTDLKDYATAEPFELGRELLEVLIVN